MKKCYMVEGINKVFDTEEEADKAEKALLEKKEKEEQKKKERSQRAHEIDEAFKELKEAQNKYNDLLSAFIRDYNSYHVTYNSVEDFPSVFDFLPFKLF